MFIIFVGVDSDWLHGEATEAEMHEFCVQHTSYTPLDPQDDPDFYEHYDPQVCVVFEGEDLETADTRKYARPVAIYVRGQRYDCIPVGGIVTNFPAI